MSEHTAENDALRLTDREREALLDAVPSWSALVATVEDIVADHVARRACRCVPDNEWTVRDEDTREPLEYVRYPGFWGWFRSGWQVVVCPVHDAPIPPGSSDGGES